MKHQSQLIIQSFFRYYRNIKYNSGKFWLIWDVITMALLLIMILMDLWLPPNKDLSSGTQFFISRLFLVKYLEFFYKSMFYNAIHRRKYCSVCLTKPKQQINNSNTLTFKYCICVCRKCERFTSDCNACKFTISTHFR